jgi:hypothetical protein
LRNDGLICYSMAMTKDEEIEQLRADNRILYGALLRQAEELEQAKQANQVLRDGVTIINGQKHTLNDRLAL